MDILELANQARQRKQKNRENFKKDEPVLFELYTLIRNHLRLVKQTEHSARKLKKFVQENFQTDNILDFLG